MFQKKNGLIICFLFVFSCLFLSSCVATESTMTTQEEVETSSLDFSVDNVDFSSNQEFGWVNPVVTMTNKNAFAVQDAVLSIQLNNKEGIPIDQLEIIKEGSWQPNETHVFNNYARPSNPQEVDSVAPSKIRFHDGSYNYSDVVLK